jgi:oxygen-dependent protoporphyrinogen oxidase
LTSAAPTVHVVLLEAGGRLGGKLRTETVGGRPVDLGPDAFLARRPEAVELCTELGLADELVVPGRRTAYVWARGRLRPLPDGLALGVPTRLEPLARSGIVSPLGAARAALDLLAWPPRRAGDDAGPDRPVAEITRQRLGAEVTARLVDPLIGGIHAGDTSRMSTAAVFPALLDAASAGGSLMRALRGATPTSPPALPGHPASGEAPVFSSVRGGLSRLVDRLAQALEARQVDVRLETPVEHLELRAPDDDASRSSDEDVSRRADASARWALHTPRGSVQADAVVIATPAGPAADLLAPVDRTVASLLAAIDYADVTLVTLQVPEECVGRPLEGTGFLVPAESGRLTTACTWLTSKWPELRRPGDVVLRASTGRFGDDRPARLSDDEIVRRVVDELGPMMALHGEPTQAVVTRWVGAFPQYAVGHLERVTAIEQAMARLPGAALAGAAYRGVGIPACVASGRRAVDAVLRGPVLAGQRTR